MPSGNSEPRACTFVRWCQLLRRAAPTAGDSPSQMREEKLRVLSGRTVLLFPDADAYAEWKQRA
ncbi:hypothetical protein GR255_28390, partial [Mycobacterium tuberculosis]|nr:hypothetical protein [Mycobacterium tuberculosis]